MKRTVNFAKAHLENRRKWKDRQIELMKKTREERIKREARKSSKK